GPGSIFLLTAALYWLAFTIVAMGVARHSPQLALLVPVLGLSPPAFVLVGVIWRDILFGILWLLAAGFVFFFFRARLENTSSCSRVRFRAVRIRRPAAPERPRRRASSHSLSCMAFAFSLEARGAPLCAGRTRAICVGADHLLRRLPSGTAAPSAFDHCLRPWWHFVLC